MSGWRWKSSDSLAGRSKCSASIPPTAAVSTINGSATDKRERYALWGVLSFALGTVCFVLGATLITARFDLPGYADAVGQVSFFAWPFLIIATVILRFRGAGPRDWMMWTSLAVIVIPAVMVAVAFLV